MWKARSLGKGIGRFQEPPDLLGSKSRRLEIPGSRAVWKSVTTLEEKLA